MTTYKTCRKCGRRYSGGRCSHGKPHAARSVGSSRRHSAADVLGRDPLADVPPDMPVFSRERFDAGMVERAQRPDLTQVAQSTANVIAGTIGAAALIASQRDIPAEDLAGIEHEEYLAHIADQHADYEEFYEVVGVE